MTHDTPQSLHPDQDGPLTDALRWQLRALRTEATPTHDLWPGIVARLAAQPAPSAAPPVAPLRSTGRRRVRWIASMATAATLALALGMGWQLRPDGAGEVLVLDTMPAPVMPSASSASPTPAPTSMLAVQANAMSREYEAALREMTALHGGLPTAADTQGTFVLLDASAAQIRDALTHDPDARFLLTRLQRVYAQRLTLTQQLLTHQRLRA